MKINGFKAAAFAGGLRYKDRPDLGLITADEPAVAAGVFTKNLVQAAPVLWCKDKIKKGRARAILVNAGQANACTGGEGRRAAEASAKMVADALGCPVDDVLLASTGVIGQPLNLAKLTPAVPQLAAALDEDGLAKVADAIMTTDTRPKMAERTGVIDGKTFTVAGIAKGSGMIMPNMATMLAFVLTDAAVSQSYLQHALADATELTFNRITVDGDTSTNDTLIALASGRAGHPVINTDEDKGAKEFEKALFEVLCDLARMIAGDGEGATKLVKIAVSGARDGAEAKAAAMTVANSPLVKTALFGQDANWGRILGALGRSGAIFDPEKVDIDVDDAPLVRWGMAANGEAAASEIMRKKEYAIHIELNAGSGRAEVLTCDFSFDYVKINADYRS